jgi:ATP-binding cassette, subfamily B, bacterial PglK
MNLLSDLWSVLTPPQRRRVIWAQALSIVMAFSTIIGIASIAPFFAVLGDPQLIDHTRSLHWLYIHSGIAGKRGFEIALGFGFVTVVVLANLIAAMGSLVMIRLAWWIGTDLQSTLYGEYLARSYAFHARTHSAALFNNIVRETNRVTNDVLQNAFLAVTNIVTAAFIILSVMLLYPVIAAVMTCALGGGYALIYLAVRNRLLRAGQIQTQFFIEQTKVVHESLAAIRDVIILRIDSFFRASFEQSSRAVARAAAHTQLLGQIPRHVMECVAVVGLVALALVASGGEQGLAPRLGQLTFLGFAAYRLLPTLQQAFAAIVRIRADRAGFATIAADLGQARAKKLAGVATNSAWQDSPQQEIRLKDVSFRYESDGPLAVSSVSVRIPARAAVGFVGANGSGKTTLADLIAGLLVPESGRIEVDGTTLDEENRATWQARIAYVPQSIFLLDTTIAQNVALGVPRAAIDRSRLLAAAQLAQLDEFVSTLPLGYEHRVGERGVQLSGGQRQRVGIARALYTSASVLILDEATNALDGLTEQEIMTTLLRLRGRYTIILIAHRLSTVRACDLIFEFDRGEMTGSGNYFELLRTSETFRRLTKVT